MTTPGLQTYISRPPPHELDPGLCPPGCPGPCRHARYRAGQHTAEVDRYRNEVAALQGRQGYLLGEYQRMKEDLDFANARIRRLERQLRGEDVDR